MRRDATVFPSKAFWARFGQQVVVDTHGLVALTKRGRQTLGVALSAAGTPMTCPTPLEDFVLAANQAQPFAEALQSDMHLLEQMPHGSAERELLAQLLGVDVSRIKPRAPAQVVDFVRARAQRAA
ncbi:hypothetical protein D3C71_21490 [compost metagenome]